MGQLGFYLDQSACLGCFACQMACKDWYDTETTFFRHVQAVEEGRFPATRLSFLSQACHHCAEPKCAEVCPVGAITKRADGVVVQDPTICVGCQYCVWACPYGAPQMVAERGRVEKCNLCYERLDAGEQPVCVAACISRALQFGDMEELQKKASVTQNVAGFPDPSLTHPSMLFSPPKPRVARNG